MESRLFGKYPGQQREWIFTRQADHWRVYLRARGFFVAALFGITTDFRRYPARSRRGAKAWR
jgi:hypothetical protein